MLSLPPKCDFGHLAEVQKGLTLADGRDTLVPGNQASSYLGILRTSNKRSGMAEVCLCAFPHGKWSFILKLGAIIIGSLSDRSFLSYAWKFSATTVIQRVSFISPLLNRRHVFAARMRPCLLRSSSEASTLLTLFNIEQALVCQRLQPARQSRSVEQCIGQLCNTLRLGNCGLLRHFSLACCAACPAQHIDCMHTAPLSCHTMRKNEMHA